jgi:sugar-phosphatase
MKTKFEAVIFDMDGVLIDSEPFWRKAEIEVFETVGLHLTESDCMKTTGFRFDEVVEYWFHLHPWQGKTVAEVEEEVIDKMEHYILHDAPLMPQAKETVQQVWKFNVKTAVASSSALRLIQAMAKRLGGEHSFHALVSAEFEPYGKPHPAVFLSAAKQLGVKPQKCLVVEDSLNGVIAAKAAKMSCAAIPYPQDFDNPKLAIADFKFRSIKEVLGLM